MKIMVIPIIVASRGAASKNLEKKSEGTRNQRENHYYKDHSIAKFILNNQEFRDLRRLDVTYTPVRDHELMLV